MLPAVQASSEYYTHSSVSPSMLITMTSITTASIIDMKNSIISSIIKSTLHIGMSAADSEAAP